MTSRKTGHRVHAFPKDKATLRQWVQFVHVRRADFSIPSVTKNSKVCSAHFTEEDYDQGDVRMVSLGLKSLAQLIPNAVPSVHTAHASLCLPCPETERHQDRHLRPVAAGHLRDRRLPGSQQHTAQFIKLRGENDELFTGVKNSASVAWGTILEKIGLQGKDCKYPGSGEGVGGKPTAVTWPWFVPMDEVLGQRHSTNPPVLIASIPENTPGPNTAVVVQEVEDKGEEERQRGPRSRKRDREEEMFQLIKEDMRLNREAEERRANESRERMDRFFSILERLVDK
ncbi:unnamed protein product [Boreogadus saida]